MKYLDLQRLTCKMEEIQNSFKSKLPFRYLIIDNFFPNSVAKSILQSIPLIDHKVWDGKTYMDQKKKFQLSSFEEGTVLGDTFDELNSKQFVNWLEDITGFTDLTGDNSLFGGGLHQTINGGFLNVHIDYNIHPKTKLPRKLNVIVFLNLDWKEEYKGHFELWDLRNSPGTLMERILPDFNRCVIFETNEISFHGHPSPLSTPKGVARKSLATYYYSTKPTVKELVQENHNTIFANTQGITGNVRRISNGFQAMWERIYNLFGLKN